MKRSYNILTTLIHLQYLHAKDLVIVLYRALKDDANLLIAVIDNRPFEIVEKIELPNKDVMIINNYHNRYKDSFRGVDGDTIDSVYVGS
jgi:hypothetical protein